MNGILLGHEGEEKLEIEDLIVEIRDLRDNYKRDNYKKDIKAQPLLPKTMRFH